MSGSLKCICLFCIISMCMFLSCGKISGDNFDSNKWKHADLYSEENWSLRWDMMNSLRNNYHLTGMSKSEVIQLLGEPDEGRNSNSFCYGLGYTHTGINAGSLTLLFENERVINIHVHEG